MGWSDKGKVARDHGLLGEKKKRISWNKPIAEAMNYSDLNLTQLLD